MTNGAQAMAAQPAAEAQTDSGAAAVSQAAQAAVPATPAANGEWHSGITNEATRTWAQAKGWKDPLAAVESAYNLEKLIGFDKAGRTVVIPGDDATPEQRAAYNQKIGVPESVDGYKFALPEGMDPAFSKVASKWFHDNGVPAKAAEGIVKEWNEYQGGLKSQQDKAFEAESNLQFGEIKAEWGRAYDERIEVARRGMVQFLPAESAEARSKMMSDIEGVMGTKNFLKFSYALGAGLGEHKMHNAENSGMMTPAQASQKIAELKSNKEWTGAYLSGDKTKARELQDLISMASPEA